MGFPGETDPLVHRVQLTSTGAPPPAPGGSASASAPSKRGDFGLSAGRRAANGGEASTCHLCLRHTTLPLGSTTLINFIINTIINITIIGSANSGEASTCHLSPCLRHTTLSLRTFLFWWRDIDDDDLHIQKRAQWKWQRSSLFFCATPIFLLREICVP